MPELGKATYELVFDTRQVANIDTAETQVVGATDRMDTAIVGLEGAVRELSGQVGVLGTSVSTSFAEGAAGAEAGAAKIEAASAATGVAAEKAAAKSESAFMRFGKVGGSMGKLIGLGVAFEFIKGGVEWMKSAQEGQMAIAGAIRQTHNAAGVTIGSLSKLSDTITDLTGNTKGENFQMEQMLLRFRNIRNVGHGTVAIFDRAAMMVTNIAAVTHRSTQMIALAMGKVLNDPANNLNSLGRAGIRFNKVQQDTIKQIQAGKQTFQGYTGVLGAQLYVLNQLRSYDDAAKDRSHSLRVEMLKVRDSFERSSASILQSFIPALRTLGTVLTHIAGMLAHHTKILRVVIIAYLALKVAAIGFRMVMATYRFAQWIAGFVGLATSVEAESSVTKGAAASNAIFGGSLTALLGPIALVAAALAGLYVWYTKMNALTNMVEGANNGIGTNQRQGNQFYALRARSLERGGMSPRDATAQAADETHKRFPGWKSSTEMTTGVSSGAYNATPAVIPQEAAKKKKKKALHGADLLPISLQIALAKAGLTKSNADDMTALGQQKSYLEGLLKHAKANSPKQLAILQELDGVQSQLDSLISMQVKKHKKHMFDGVIPIGLSIAYQKALQTKSLKDDERVLRAEEKYLQTMLRNHKLSADKKLAFMKALTEVKKKLAEALKSEANKSHLIDQEMQAVVDTRGSFFSQFASSIFHAGSGGMEMGSSAGGGNTISQTNHFNEIPKDRFAIARQMQRAAAAAT